MIYFFEKLKINKLKTISHKLNAGMTYVELIVVLSIFSVLSSIAVYNYGDFQAKVDIKNLSSDVALKIVEAQKSSLSGLLPPSGAPNSTWKPSYGLYFNLRQDNKSFLYFTDLNNNLFFDGADCNGECLNKVSITKDNYISDISIFDKDDPNPDSVDEIALTFSRPDSGAKIQLGSFALEKRNILYMQITISSPSGVDSLIKVYTSGRIEVK